MEKYADDGSAMALIVKRPKRDETEEDCLRLQEQFLASQNDILLAKKRKDTTKMPPIPKSPQIVTNALAETSDINPTNITGNKKKKMSIFAKRMLASGSVPLKQEQKVGPTVDLVKKDHLILSDVQDKGNSKSHRQVPSLTSGLDRLLAIESEKELNGSDVLDSIHDENVRILSRLSEEEILAERERIVGRLSPSLVKFVQNRSKGNKGLSCKKSSALFTLSSSSSSGGNLEKSSCVGSDRADEDVKDDKIKGKITINDRSIEEKVSNNVQISIQTDYDDCCSSILKSTDETVRKEARINATAPTEVPKESWPKERLGLKNACKKINLGELQEISDPVDLSRAAQKYEWMHMADVEKCKLEWVCEPVGKTSSGDAGGSVRFDFEGRIVTDSPQRWEREELYHHGDEPDKAGYTLQDLFVLLRSTFTQQQLVGLKTLSLILDRAKSGSYHGKLSKNIFPTLADSGIVVLARLSLDSPLVAVHEAAARLFCSLLVNADDELALDQSFTWYRGEDSPMMNADDDDDDDNDGNDNDPESNDGDDREDKEKPTDEDVIRKDLIKGLLVRTSFLQRLNYLLTIHQPGASSNFVENVLDILVRVARHHRHGEHDEDRGKQSARRRGSDSSGVYDCPGLLKNVVEKFLPLLKNGAGYSQPTELRSELSAKVIKLLRTLAASDACVAQDLCREYGENVFQHICASSQLCTCHEALRFWTVLLRYGFGIDRLKQHHAFIAEKLSSLASCTNTMHESADPTGGCLAIGVVEAGVNVAAEVSVSKKAKEADPSDASVLPELQWSVVIGHLSVVLTIAENCIKEFVEKYCIKKYTTYGPLASALNCLATYIEKGDSEIDPILYDDVGRTLKSFLLSCFESPSFGRTVEKLRENSMIIPDAVNYRPLGECADSFRTLESTFVDDDSQLTVLAEPSAMSSLKPSLLLVTDPASPSSQISLPYSSISRTSWHPVVHPLSAVPFLSSVARLVFALSSKREAAELEKCDLMRKLLLHRDVQLYLTKIGAARGSALKGGWFSRFEVHVVYFLVMIAKELLLLSTPENRKDSPVDPVFYHKVALNLLTHFQSGDELMVLRMFNVLLSEEFFSDVFGRDDVEETLALETNRASKAHCITADLRSNLEEMRVAYVDQFFDAESAERSSKSLSDKCLEVNCMVVGRCGRAVLPFDWLYQPLLRINYLWKKSRVKKHCDDISLKSMLKGLVKTCQQAIKVIFLLEKCREKMISHIGVELKIARIMQAVMAAGEDLLSDDTYFYIDQLVQIFSAKKYLSNTTDRSKSAGMSSVRKIDVQFYDMYLKEHVSFFAPLLTFNVITLFPLVYFDGCDGQGPADRLWHLLWLSNLEAVKYLPIGFDQLPFSVESLLKPQDQDNLHLIKCYFNCLHNKWLSHDRAPVPYLIAVHNVNRFLYSNSTATASSTIVATENGDASRISAEMESTKKLFAKQIFTTSWPDARRKHVLTYKQANFETKLGFHTYDVLPQVRLKRLVSLVGMTVEDIVLMLQK